MSSNTPDHSHQNIIYVGHLPRNITDGLIHQIMDSVGNITKITIHQKPTNAYAYVTFETHDEAARAISECNYTKLNDQPIQVSWYESVPNNYAPDSKIVITNLPASVDETQLHEALKLYGPVVNCKILRNLKGESKGSGYVQFEKAEDAHSAHEALQEAVIDGHQIKVDFYKPIDKRQDILLKLPPSVICVSGPEDQINIDNLKKLFTEYGEILDVQIISGYGVVFFENQTSASRANAEFHAPSLTVTTSMKKEIQQEILKIVESQRVFISDITVSSEDEIREHLQTAGKVNYLEIRPQQDGSYTGIAQFSSAEVRNRAIQLLDRTFFSSQLIPIRVLPYFDKRLEHPKAGLLQLNEVPCYVTIRNLREEMNQYGNVIAITIVATTQVTCVGYVLYENYADAQKAHQECKYTNSFLYQPLSVNDIVGAFCDNLESRIIICYNIDPKETIDSFQKKYGINLVDGIWIDEKDDHKTIIMSCMTPSGVSPAIHILRTQGVECDVLGIRIMNRAYRILNTSMIDLDVRERLLFCSGIGRTTTNADLKREFEAIGPVESAFVIYSPLNNESEEKGLVLYKQAADAAVARQTPIISTDFGPNFTVTEFKQKGFKDKTFNQVPPMQQIPQQMPPQQIQQQMQQQMQQMQQMQQIPPPPQQQMQFMNRNQGGYNNNNNNRYGNNNNNNNYRRNGGRNKRGNGYQHNQNNRNHQQDPQLKSPRERMISYVREHVTDNQLQQKLIDEINQLCVKDVYQYGTSDNLIEMWIQQKTKPADEK